MKKSKTRLQIRVTIELNKQGLASVDWFDDLVRALGEEKSAPVILKYIGVLAAALKEENE